MKRTKKQPVTRQIKKYLSSPSNSSSPSQELIAKWHRLNEQFSLINSSKNYTSDEHQKLTDQICKEQDDLGGLIAYQQASLYGSKRFNTAQWLVRQLRTQITPNSSISLLDVGALELSYDKYRWIDAKYIDIRPQIPAIKQIDFLQWETDATFNIICLSLLLNYLGCSKERGQMIKRAAEMTVTNAGYLYIVLPVHCLCNSLHLTTTQFIADIMVRFGLKCISWHVSKRLIFFLFSNAPTAEAVEAWDIGKDMGKGMNHFAIEY